MFHILNEFSNTIQLKHLIASVLSILLTYLFFSHVNYSILPIWVLRFEDSANYSDFIFRAYAYPSEVSDNPSEHSPILLTYGFNSIRGSTIVIYALPQLKELEDFLANRDKSRAFHRISPIKRIVLQNETIAAVTIAQVGQFLTCAVLTTLTVATNDQLSSHYDVLLTDELWRTRWRQSISVPSVVRSHNVAKLLIDTTCRNLEFTLCGTLYVFVPTVSDDHERFVVAALSLKDGTILWKTDSENHAKGRHEVPKTLLHKHWKLTLLQQAESVVHENAVSWSRFSDKLADILPLRWHNSADSKLVPLHLFHSSSDNIPVPAWKKPDAVAVVHSLGVDLFDATSGKLHSRMAFQWRSGSSYASIPTLNQTSLLFKSLDAPRLHEIRISSTIIAANENPSNDIFSSDYLEPDLNPEEQSDFRHTVNCRGVVERLDFDADGRLSSRGTSGAVYNSLCRPHSVFDFARFGRPEWLEDESKSVAPVVVNRPFTSSGILNLLNYILPIGSSVQPRFGPHSTSSYHDPSNSFDLLFLTSDGSLTSISNLGFENWRVNAEVSWLQMSRSLASSDGTQFDSNLEHFYRLRFRPSLLAVDVRPLGVDAGWSRTLLRLQSTRSTMDQNSQPTDPFAIPVVVSVGWDSVSMVDRYSGHVLGTHRLPTHPVGQPFMIPVRLSSSSSVLVNSLVAIPCDGMLVVFALQAQVLWFTALVIILALFLSFSLLTIFCASDSRDEENAH